MTNPPFPIPPGLYCVPSAIIALTGAEPHSVVFPALNRVQKSPWMHGPVGGVHIHHTKEALGQMGWNVREHKGTGMHEGRARLKTWALRSGGRYKGLRLLVATTDHMLALYDGKVYDCNTPYGGDGAKHAYANDTVRWAAVIEKKES